MSVAAANLGIDWTTVNKVAVESARTLVYEGGHLDGVRYLGEGRAQVEILNRIQKGLPPGLEELAQLSRTMRNQRAEILAYFDAGVSNGPAKPSTNTWNSSAESPKAAATSLTTSCDPLELGSARRQDQRPLKSKEPSKHRKLN